ncbi:hypothetical protein ACF0H5_013614 [Mactra antiquata]
MTSSLKRPKRPGIGIGVFVISDKHPGCVLIGKRKGSTGEGLYALIGGHLDFGESWDACAVRETEEEAGLQLRNVTYCTVVNAVDLPNDYHYVTIFMKGEIDPSSPLQEPQNLEPDKCEGWFWCKWNDLPSSDQLFCALRVLRDSGYSPFQ